MEKIRTVEAITTFNSDDDWKDTKRDLIQQHGDYSIDEMCNICIKKQMDLHGAITIPCKGLATLRTSLEKELGDKISPEFYTEILGTVGSEALRVSEEYENSYTWIENNIIDPDIFSPRPYQRLINSCLKGDTKISMSDGSFKNIKDIAINDEIVSYNQGKKKFTKSIVTNTFDQGIKDIYKITLENRDELYCTDNHPILSWFKGGELNKLHSCPSYKLAYKSIKDGLSEGMDVITQNRTLGWGKVSNVNLAIFLGYLMTDGYIDRKSAKIQFSNIRKQYVEEFISVSEQVFGTTVRYETLPADIDKHGINRKETYRANITSAKAVFDFLESIGCSDKTNKEISIFEYALNNFDEESTKLFINRAYAGDGSLVTSNTEKSDVISISFHGALNSPLILNWHRLLRKIGVWSSTKVDKRGEHSNSCVKIGKSDCAKQFLDFSGLIYGKEKESVNILEAIERRTRKSKRGIFKNTTRTLITSIEYVGKDNVYDIEVEKYHNFVANNIVVHNCTAKMKVLRMGRRCISEDTYVRGVKKDYKAKHLYHKFLHKKKLPLIEAFEEKTGKIVLTDKYVILPNGLQTTFKVMLSNGYSVSVTGEHPIIIYKNKHYHFETVRKLKKGDLVLTTDNKLVPIVNITRHKEITYHLSVVHYETFITRGGFIHHNTGKTIAMAIGLLHRLVTRENYKVLMVAPMVTMIDEVVDQIKKYCKELKVNPIVRATSNPINLIEFTTGSTFKGVSAGASGAKGTRGKAADLLYMDECFPAGTKIRMLDGSAKSIEEVEEGDYVLSFDEKTKKLVSRRVVKTKCTGYKDVYEFKTISGKKITATNNHPVYTRQGWKSICEADDIATLNTKTGTYYHESILGARSKGIARVYNLEVEDTHTYIANDFIVHNCDFLSSKDLNSLLAIINDNAEVEVWASSTPIGQGNLYKLGTDPMFKEFHFPSFVTDHYTDQIDTFNRRNLTPIAYQQEVLANYGASEESVFQIKFVDQATYADEDVEVNWPLIRDKDRRDYIITMGVDWNRDVVGTRIVVVAYNKITSRYYILHSARVAKLGWTQIEAINTIVECNEVYDVDHVYVDDGHGETQASLLRMYGQQKLIEEGPKSAGSRLMYTKAVMFGSSLILKDPVTGEELKKQTKQYMVDNTANLLSRGNLVLLSEADNDIVMQLKNYTVKAISSKGLKSFTARDKQIGDHDLDAYMLALHAIHQEYSELAGNSPMGTVLSLFNNPLNGDADIGSTDNYAIIGSSSNIVLNTRRTMVESSFRNSRTKGFRARRKL